MDKLITGAIIRAGRTAIAVWIAAALAHNVWFAPILVAISKALRDKFPGKVEWLPV